MIPLTGVTLLYARCVGQESGSRGWQGGHGPEARSLADHLHPAGHVVSPWSGKPDHGPGLLGWVIRCAQHWLCLIPRNQAGFTPCPGRGRSIKVSPGASYEAGFGRSSGSGGGLFAVRPLGDLAAGPGFGFARPASQPSASCNRFRADISLSRRDGSDSSASCLSSLSNCFLTRESLASLNNSASSSSKCGVFAASCL